LDHPSVGKRDAIILPVIGAEDWRAPIKEYLLTGSLSLDRMEVVKQTKRASRYYLIDGVLYR